MLERYGTVWLAPTAYLGAANSPTAGAAASTTPGAAASTTPGAAASTTRGAAASTTPEGACATASAILTAADSYFENSLDCILLINLIGNHHFHFTLSLSLQLFPLYLVIKPSRLFLSKET